MLSFLSTILRTISCWFLLEISCNSNSFSGDELLILGERNILKMFFFWCFSLFYFIIMSLFITINKSSYVPNIRHYSTPICLRRILTCRRHLTIILKLNNYLYKFSKSHSEFWGYYLNRYLHRKRSMDREYHFQIEAKSNYNASLSIKDQTIEIESILLRSSIVDSEESGLSKFGSLGPLSGTDWIYKSIRF